MTDAKRIRVLEQAVREYAELTERVKRQIAALHEPVIDPDRPLYPCTTPFSPVTESEAKMLVVIDRVLYYSGRDLTLPADVIALARRISDEMHEKLNGPFEV
jgi:phosphoenolpyruvate carboxylase